MSYKLALLTPLHPQRTGVADWIEEMLPHIRGKLGTEYQIDLFVENCTPTEKDTIAHHRILDLNDYENCYSSYDLAIYQMGNSPFHLSIYQAALKHPGIVILHDYAIHNVVAKLFRDVLKDDAAYFDEVGSNHGEEAKNLARQRAAKGELGLWEADAFRYPMTRRLVESSLGVVVFSQLAKNNLEAYGCHVPVHRIYLHCGGPVKECSPEERDQARRHLNLRIARDEVLIGTFGFVGEAKRPISILNAVQRLRASGAKARLVYVGELQERCRKLPRAIEEKGLSPYVTVTGYVNSEEFLEYLKACDINVSLRNPTMGENSGPLMRALSMGKPSVVTDIGTFQEFPEGVVLKISPGDNEEVELTQALQKLMDDPKCRKAMEKASLAYAKVHLEIESTAEDLASFIKEAVRFKAIEDDGMYQRLRDKVVDIYQELGCPDKTLLERAAGNLADIFGGAR